MLDKIYCTSQAPQLLSSISENTDPKDYLLENYGELLKERVIMDASENEIGSR